MKKIIFALVFCFSLFVNAYAQDDYSYPHPRPKNCNPENSCPRNTLFHETNIKFGTLGLNSINWDHILVCRTRYLTSIRIGIDYMSFSKISSAGVPIDLNLMLGGGAIMLELGIGLNYLYVYKNYDDSTGTKFKDKINYLAATGRVGLRYEKQHSPFVRLGWTPMYSLMNYKKISILADKQFLSMFGLGIGYTF